MPSRCTRSWLGLHHELANIINNIVKNMPLNEIQEKGQQQILNSTCLVPKVCGRDSLLCHNEIITSFFVRDKEPKE